MTVIVHEEQHFLGIEIQISNVNVIVLWHSLLLPFNQSQESLQQMAFSLSIINEEQKICTYRIDSNLKIECNRLVAQPTTALQTVSGVIATNI